MKTTIIIVAAVVVVLVGFFLFRSNSNITLETTESPTVSVTASASASPTVSVSASPSPTASSVSKVDTFTISAANFSFSPKNLTVNKGDTVKIVFQNNEGTHDWVIDEFNARTPRIGGGQTATIQFVANKTGSFQYYCSVGSHRALGMWGTLTVK